MFSSWTVALEHYPFLHQILLLTPLKHLKQDRTFCYEEVLPLWQKALQYLKGINWNNFRMCNVFWICVRELNHCFNGYFLELLDVRQTSWGCSKIWVTEKIRWTSSSWECPGRFKPTGTMNRISVYLRSQVSESSQNPQRKGNLAHKKLFTTGVLEASHPELLTGRVLAMNSTGLQAESWLWACCHKWHSQGMYVLYYSNTEEFTIKSRKQFISFDMWTVTKILTAVANENVADFIRITSLRAFFLLLNPFSHHRLKVLENLFSNSLPIFRVRMTWLSFSFPYFDSVLFAFW